MRAGEIRREAYENEIIEELSQIWECSIGDADMIAALIVRTTAIELRELAALARAGMLEFQLTQIKVAP